jgi:hypothetical protein
MEATSVFGSDKRQRLPTRLAAAVAVLIAVLAVLAVWVAVVTVKEQVRLLLGQRTLVVAVAVQRRVVWLVQITAAAQVSHTLGSRSEMSYHNAHAARIDDNNIVQQVIVIPYLNDNDDEITAYCNSLGLSGRWIDTSFLGARRSKYAGIGDTYDAVNDVFVAPMIEEDPPVEA